MNRHPLETDLSAAEREAYQRGDIERAELLGALMDSQEEESRADSLQSIVDGIRDRITEANWRTGKKAELRELVEAIVNELAEGSA